MMENYQQENLLKNPATVKTKIYRKRWIILVIFYLIAASSAFQWFQFTIITNIIEEYYNVSTSFVNWTSIVYMVGYAIFILPASYLINTRGLRFACLAATIGTFLGATIKLFALIQDDFYIILLGQTIAGVSQVFILSLPSKIAAVWFKPSEASLVCSIAVMGTQIGFALGFLIPTILVENDANTKNIGTKLKLLYWSQFGFMLVLALTVICYFPKQPLLPPTQAQHEERTKPKPTIRQFLPIFGKLFLLEGFLSHTIAYGIMLGVFQISCTFLNQLVLYYFPNGEKDAGLMGLLVMVVGNLGLLVFGTVLGKTRKYKEVTLFLCYLTVVSCIAFLCALNWKNKLLTYLAVTALGFFANSYISVGYELSVEISFPADESATTGIVTASGQIICITFTEPIQQLLTHCGPVWTLICELLLLVFATILTHFVPNIRKRQDAFNREQEEKKQLQSEI